MLQIYGKLQQQQLWSVYHYNTKNGPGSTAKDGPCGLHSTGYAICFHSSQQNERFHSNTCRVATIPNEVRIAQLIKYILTQTTIIGEVQGLISQFLKEEKILKQNNENTH
jgi:hypothetical protein